MHCKTISFCKYCKLGGSAAKSHGCLKMDEMTEKLLLDSFSFLFAFQARCL